jgi:hypothetical protein
LLFILPIMHIGKYRAKPSAASLRQSQLRQSGEKLYEFPQTKTPAMRAFRQDFLAEGVRFAYIPQAAESLASDSLRISPVSRAGGLLPSANRNARYAGV